MSKTLEELQTEYEIVKKRYEEDQVTSIKEYISIINSLATSYSIHDQLDEALRIQATASMILMDLVVEKKQLEWRREYAVSMTLFASLFKIKTYGLQST